MDADDAKNEDLEDGNELGDYDDEKELQLAEFKSSSHRQKILEAQLLDEQLGTEDDNVLCNDEMTKEHENNENTNKGTLNEIDDTLIKLSEWHKQNDIKLEKRKQSLLEINNIEESDLAKSNDNVSDTVKYFNHRSVDDDDGPETDENIQKDSSTSVENIKYINELLSFKGDNFQKKILHGDNYETDNIDIKINSLKNMLDSASNTPRQPLMDFSKFLTGDGSNNLPDLKFPTQEELENELLNDQENFQTESELLSKWKITKESLDMEYNVSELEANLRGFSNDLDSLLGISEFSISESKINNNFYNDIESKEFKK